MCGAALIFITGQPFFNLTGVCPFHNSTAISMAQIPAGRTYNTASGINTFPIEKVCNAAIAKNVCPAAAITAILPQIFNVFFALKSLSVLTKPVNSAVFHRDFCFFYCLYTM